MRETVNKKGQSPGRESRMDDGKVKKGDLTEKAFTRLGK